MTSAEQSRHRGLGLEVRRLVGRHHRRRRIPTTLHLGVPGGRRRELAVDPAWDDGLRADVLLRLVGSCLPGERVWLTRGGDVEVRDGDLAWLRAARLAAAAHRLPMHSFAVVTRSGWRDLLTDEEQTWARPRPLQAPVGVDGAR